MVLKKYDRLGNGYKHSKRDFILNGNPGKANRMATPQKRLCCDTPNTVTVFKPNNQVCCPRIIRSGVNSNVSMTANGTYKRDDNKTYYFNSSQRLKAKKMSYKTNVPTQKNNVSQYDSTLGGAKCCMPVDKTRYGLHNHAADGNKVSHVMSGTDSSNRTFALSHVRNTVFNKKNTEEEKKPNKECLNKKDCYRKR
jgi:hypothetical protein